MSAPKPTKAAATDTGLRLCWPSIALVTVWSLLLVTAGVLLPASALTWILLMLATVPVALVAGALARRRSGLADRRLSEALGHWERDDFRGHLPPEGVAPELRWVADPLNRLADRLETENHRLQRFSLAASHELRNPLAAARAYLELAQRRLTATGGYKRNGDGGRGDGSVDGYVAHALREVDRLWLLVEGLLLLARDAPLSTPFESHPVRLAEVVADALEIVRPAVKLKAQSLEVETDGTAFVTGDRQRLYLAIFKLCDNAVRFTPRGGTLRVRLQRHDRFVDVEIDDQGPGIPEAGMPEILGYFEPEDRASAGASLGLSLVRRVALSHDGALDAEPLSRGGTRFRLRLPALLYPVEHLDEQQPGVGA